MQSLSTGGIFVKPGKRDPRGRAGLGMEPRGWSVSGMSSNEESLRGRFPGGLLCDPGMTNRLQRGDGNAAGKTGQAGFVVVELLG